MKQLNSAQCSSHVATSWATIAPKFLTADNQFGDAGQNAGEKTDSLPVLQSVHVFNHHFRPDVSL